MNEDKLKQIQKLLDSAEGNLHSARNLMRELVGTSGAQAINPGEKAKSLNVIEEGKIIEGVYNGESMVGPDGKEYPVPANYASKSKLVEGDVLKLTIADDGSFIFKQIKPLERRKTIGTLVYDNGSYTVTADGKSYKVLPASVTYYKGEAGDQVTILLPKEHESSWAAVENIIKSNGTTPPAQTAETTPETTGSEPETSQPEPVDTSNDEPTIEFPGATNTQNETPAEDNVEPTEMSAEDENIIQNFSNPAQTAEPTPSEPAVPAQDQSDEPDEGIKELEI